MKISQVIGTLAAASLLTALGFGNGVALSQTPKQTPSQIPSQIPSPTAKDLTIEFKMSGSSLVSAGNYRAQFHQKTVRVIEPSGTVRIYDLEKDKVFTLDPKNSITWKVARRSIPNQFRLR